MFIDEKLIWHNNCNIINMKMMKKCNHPNLKNHLVFLLYTICRLIETLIELITMGYYTSEIYDVVVFNDKIDDWCE